MNDKLLDDYLKQWDDSVSESYLRNLNQTNTRREFLRQLVVGSAAVVFSNNILANTANLNDGVWKTFIALHLHLFPASSDSPDANTINASAYLKSITEWPGIDSSDKKFILDGVGWLNGVAIKSYQNRFEKLTNNQKETVLRQVEKSKAGGNWLSLVLLYLMEALLTDPV